MWEALIKALELFPASVQRIIVCCVLVALVAWEGARITDKQETAQRDLAREIVWLREAGHKRDNRLDKVEDALAIMSRTQSQMAQLQVDTTATLNRVQDRLDDTPHRK